jgi:BlaI family transcriptional regulator, penicillinase repressor
MSRPRAKQLTERELQVMQIFWKFCELTAIDVRQHMANADIDRAYTTIATIVRILMDKGFLARVPGRSRPFRFRAIQKQEVVSARILADVVDRLFQGSREQLSLCLRKQKQLSFEERAFLVAYAKGTCPDN